MIFNLAIGAYRFNEKLIRPATAIYAPGLFRTLGHTPSTAYLEKQIKVLLRLRKLQPHRYLSQFNIDANGKIRKQEWRAIRHKARQQVISKIERHQAQNLLSDQDRSGRPFILSAVREKSWFFAKKYWLYRQGALHS